jgi:hypothetical protein
MAALAATVLVVVAIPASARIDHHFSADIRNAQFHGDRDAFRLRAMLVATFNGDDQVGRLQIHCRQSGDKSRCAGIVHLNGEVGGEGFLYVRGNLGHGDNSLNVTGGTDDFAGASGRIGGPKNRLHFHLVR